MCTLIPEAEVEPSPSVDRLWITMLEEPIPEAFENVVVKGHATMLADMLQKWPNQVSAFPSDIMP